MRKTILKNVERLKPKTFRCRVMINGKNLEHYETSLNRAKTWVRTMKTVSTTIKNYNLV